MSILDLFRCSYRPRFVRVSGGYSRDLRDRTVRWEKSGHCEANCIRGTPRKVHELLASKNIPFLGTASGLEHSRRRRRLHRACDFKIVLRLAPVPRPSTHPGALAHKSWIVSQGFLQDRVGGNGLHSMLVCPFLRPVRGSKGVGRAEHDDGSGLREE